MYIFAEKESTGEIYEVLTIEMYQGDVMFIEYMDMNGLVTTMDNPEGLKYILQHKTRGDDEDK